MYSLNNQNKEAIYFKTLGFTVSWLQIKPFIAGEESTWVCSMKSKECLLSSYLVALRWLTQKALLEKPDSLLGSGSTFFFPRASRCAHSPKGRFASQMGLS